MKIKTIKKIITKKLDAWFESITDETTREAARKDTIVTGGSIASMLLKESVNDFDVYLRTKETCKLVAQYYANQSNEVVKVVDGKDAIIEKKKIEEEELNGEYTDNSMRAVFIKSMDETRIKLYVAHANFYAMPDAKTNTDDETGGVSADNVENKNEFKPLFFSANAITLTDQLQIVVRFHGEPQEIHKNYDFVHATNYYDSGSKKLVLRQEALESLLTKELMYIGSLYPVTSIIRSKKFINRGWTINAGTYLKILFQVSQLDLSDPVVLQEQLIGVDIAYFSVMLEALQGVRKESISYDYICALIDKIFGEEDQ